VKSLFALLLLGSVMLASIGCEAKVADKDGEHGAAVKVDTK
jgi:hypothetical protein